MSNISAESLALLGRLASGVTLPFPIERLLKGLEIALIFRLFLSSMCTFVEVGVVGDDLSDERVGFLNIGDLKGRLSLELSVVFRTIPFGRGLSSVEL